MGARDRIQVLWRSSQLLTTEEFSKPPVSNALEKENKIEKALSSKNLKVRDEFVKKKGGRGGRKLSCLLSIKQV